MKQTRIHIIGSVALAAMLVSCAGLNKMKKNAPTVQYTVTPTVLETHAGKVDPPGAGCGTGDARLCGTGL